MLDNQKNVMLKKFVDILAVCAIVYPILLLISFRFNTLSGPLDLTAIIEALCMLLALPAAIWLTLRYGQLVKNSKSPIIHKFFYDKKLIVLIFLSIPLFWGLFYFIMSVIKPIN